MKPKSAGLLPKCTTELNIATLVTPSSDTVQIRFAGFTPLTELIILSLDTRSIASISSLV